MAIPSSYSTEQLKQCFITAAFDNNLRVIKKLTEWLVERGVTREELEKNYDEFGRNALFAAAATAKGRLDVCKYLVEELNFDVNAQDNKGDTPLHVSTLEEDLLTSAYLLDQGADPNVGTDKGWTPLHYAAKRGCIELLGLLISKGAEVNAQSTLFGTPLLAATAHGMGDSVKFLLANRADPNLGNPNTLLPLVSAIQAKSIACVRLLLEWGADPNSSARDMTPLVAAAQEGQNDIIKLLLRVGADPNVADFYNLTPIEIAAQLGNHAGVTALFPATKPIPRFPDWSVQGILEHAHSSGADIKINFNTEEKFLEAKAKGAEAFKKAHFVDAASWYTDALSLKPTDAAVLSNRSLCWARLNEGARALEDAMACMQLRDDWPKAHYRAGVAYALLKNFRMAVNEFRIAIRLDPNNKELQDAYRAALDLSNTNV